jgi:hypothetical protein
MRVLELRFQETLSKLSAQSIGACFSLLFFASREFYRVECALGMPYSIRST